MPPRVLTNADLERLVETSNEWILERTGIRERHIADPATATSDMAIEAARCALAQRGIAASELEAILVCTVTPDMMFPSTACLVQHGLGAKGAWGFDLIAACSSFVYGLTTGAHLVAAGTHKKVLVVGADTMSRIIDYTDRATCVLFGDASAGALITAGDDSHTGFLGFELGADGTGAKDMGINVGGSACPAHQPHQPADEYLFMNGREVFKFATRVIIDSTTRVLNELDLTMDDIDLFIPHQANTRIIDHAVEKLGVDPAKVVVNVERYGNTSSASVPLAMTEARDDGRLKPGALVLMIAFGGGLTWGTAVGRYEPEGAA